MTMSSPVLCAVILLACAVTFGAAQSEYKLCETSGIVTISKSFFLSFFVYYFRARKIKNVFVKTGFVGVLCLLCLYSLMFTLLIIIYQRVTLLYISQCICHHITSIYRLLLKVHNI